MAVVSAPLALDRPLAQTVTRVLPRVIPELDGVRGLAILLVLCWHSSDWLKPAAPLRFLEYGHIGVDLFFVLSGFLITGILLDTRGDENRVKNFYIRRGLRIWPLYFGYLAGAALLFRWMIPAIPHLWIYALFLQNFLAGVSTGPVLQPTWSLAVEEQFYAAWPWLAFRCQPHTLLKVCVGIITASPIVRLAYYALGCSEWFVYANTLTRLDALAAGAVLAISVRSVWFRRETLQQYGAAVLAVSGIAALIMLQLAKSGPLARLASYSFIALACAGLVAVVLAQQGEASLLTQLFRQPWLRFLGKISFALYLFNDPIYVLMHGHHAEATVSRMGISGISGELVLLVTSQAVLIAAAWLSWKFIEAPALKLKARLAPQ